MIRYLRTFVVAAETESFSAAGNRLGLTQSAVSTQIRRLEDELGYALFTRTGKSVTLSDEGADVLEQAARILESFEGAEKRGQPILGEIVGFGATSDAGHVTDPSADGAARAATTARGCVPLLTAPPAR